MSAVGEVERARGKEGCCERGSFVGRRARSTRKRRRTALIDESRVALRASREKLELLDEDLALSDRRVEQVAERGTIGRHFGARCARDERKCDGRVRRMTYYLEEV